MQDVKLVVSDLDGTLLDGSYLVSDFTQETIELLTAQDIIFVPCTGRDYTDIPDFLKTHANIQYIISGNGSQIIDIHNDKMLHELYLSKAEVMKVLELIPEVIPLMILTTTKGIYITETILESLSGHDEQFKEFLKANRTIVSDFMPIINDETSNICKLEFDFACPQQRLDTFKKLEIITEVAVTSAHFRNIEITHKDATKGYALTKLAELLEIDYHQRIAFGDNDNDVSMMQVVKYPVAMANATELLKKHTKYTTSSNLEEGVAHMLRKYVING